MSDRESAHSRSSRADCLILLACCWASAGYNIQIRDPGEQQRQDAVDYFNANVASCAEATGKSIGNVTVHDDLQSAVKNAWLVFEVVPEKLNIKIETFAELEKLVRNCSKRPRYDCTWC